MGTSEFHTSPQMPPDTHGVDRKEGVMTEHPEIPEAQPKCVSSSQRLEQEYGGGRIHRDTKILAEETVLAPTCITDHTGATTLFTRRYRLLRLPSGKLVVRFMVDTENPRNDDALIQFTEGMEEMPEDQPGNDYLPDEIAAARQADDAQEDFAEILEHAEYGSWIYAIALNAVYPTDPNTTEPMASGAAGENSLGALPKRASP